MRRVLTVAWCDGEPRRSCAMKYGIANPSMSRTGVVGTKGSTPAARFHSAAVANRVMAFGSTAAPGSAIASSSSGGKSTL